MQREGAGRKLNVSSLHDLRSAAMPWIFRHGLRTGFWQAWWQPNGSRSTTSSTRLRDERGCQALIPFALVAHDGERFLGTSSVIASDLEARPQLTPWVAAVWVEEDARRRGVGAALVNRAAQDCFALGVSRAYLCAAASDDEVLRSTGLDRRRTQRRRAFVSVCLSATLIPGGNGSIRPP